MAKKTDQSLKFSNSNPCSSLNNQTTVTSFLVLVNISNDYLTEKKKKTKMASMCKNENMLKKSMVCCCGLLQG